MSSLCEFYLSDLVNALIQCFLNNSNNCALMSSYLVKKKSKSLMTGLIQKNNVAKILKDYQTFIQSLDTPDSNIYIQLLEFSISYKDLNFLEIGKIH